MDSDTTISTRSGAPRTMAPRTTPPSNTASSSSPPPPTPRLGLGPVGVGVRVVVAVAVLMGANLAVGGLATLLGSAPGLGAVLNETSLLTLAVFVVLQALMTASVVLMVWAWLRVVERRPLRSAGWRWRLTSLPWLMVSGGLVVATVAILPDTGPVADPDSYVGAQPVWFSLVALVAQAFLLQAIPEELLFRGWLLSALRATPLRAIVVTTLAFTVIHLVSNGGQQNLVEHLLYLAIPFGFSLLAVGLLLVTGSLWAAVGVHGGFHLGNGAAVVLLPQVDPATSWVAIGAVQAVVGLLLVLVAFRRGRGRYSSSTSALANWAS